MTYTASVLLASLLVASACNTANTDHELREATDSYQFSITRPNTPPLARDDVTYVVYVRDRSTTQPIQAGEGRIFARAGQDIEGSFVKAPQVGQYRATLRFPGPGGWLVGVQFRGDSSRKSERTRWVQEVRPATGENSPPVKGWVPWRAK